MVTALKLLRMSKGMPQVKAAKMAGISRSYYSMIESGRLVILPGDPLRQKLEKAFNRPADELLRVVELEKVV